MTWNPPDSYYDPPEPRECCAEADNDPDHDREACWQEQAEEDGRDVW